jgi:hypothetical protein
MLAYVFWHRPADDISDDEYHRPLVAFHEALRRGAPPGFHRSWVMHAEGVTWLSFETRVHEDWYLVDGSHALDPLNDAAVTGACRDPHDRVAQRAAGGAGGLYRLHSGHAHPSAYAAWLTKPARTRYNEFYQRMQTWTAAEDVSLWRRQMVLGPTSEFCLTSPSPVSLPAEYTPVVTTRHLIWPR